jgi:hypothetical protein
MPKKRIIFTRRELDLINEMAAIATAAIWGEGDYRNWTEARAKAFDSLRDKIWTLIGRRDEQNANIMAASRRRWGK